MYDIEIVILNYKCVEDTLHLTVELKEQRSISLDITVANNASPDDSGHIRNIKPVSTPRAAVLHFPESRGCACGNLYRLFMLKSRCKI